MGRNLLTISIFVLSLLFASTSPALELIQNGGFESGDLDPWEKIGENNTWTVTHENAYEGAHSGLVRGAHRIAQSFPPRLGADIEVFSLAVMTGISAWVTVEVDYMDELGPTQVDIFVSPANVWHVLDLVDTIDPDREVYRVVLSGHENGDSPAHIRTWYDAVTIQNNAVDEPPDDDDVEVIAATTKRLRVRFNLKKQRTHLSLAVRADELPEGLLRNGPVDIRVLVTQDGATTEFKTEAFLEDVPHKRDHILRLMDPRSAERVKAKW
jgi:hypothetical protein